MVLIYFGSATFSFFRSDTISNELMTLVKICHFYYTLGSLFWVERSMPEISSYKFKIHFPLKALLLIGVFAFFILVGLSGKVPIFSNNVAQSKLDFVAGKGLINLFFLGAQVSSLLLFYTYLQKNRMTKKKYFVLLSILLLVFLTGYRSSTMEYIIMLIFIYFIFNPAKIKVKTFIIAGAGILLFLSSVGALRRGELNRESLLFEFAIFTTARPSILRLIVEKSPENGGSELTYFSEFNKFSPGKHKSTNSKIKDDLFKNNHNMPELAGITPSILGEAYLNFGVDAHYFLFSLGLFFSFLHYLFLKYRSHPLMVYFYFSIIITILSSTNAGLGTIFASQAVKWFWLVLFIPIITTSKLNKHENTTCA